MCYEQLYCIIVYMKCIDKSKIHQMKVYRYYWKKKQILMHLISLNIF